MKKLTLFALGLSLFVFASVLPSSECLAQQNDKGSDSAKQDQKPRQERRGGRRGARTNDKAPKIGDLAPDFTLKSLDGKSETQLSKFKGSKPVVLFFGSYT